MPDLEAALICIEQHGSDMDQAKLNFLLTDDAPPADAVARWFHHQRADGGFAPYWADGVSSVDATCFQLSTMAQLGLERLHPIASEALDFLAGVQQRNGSWEEQASLQTVGPPWAKPGNTAATCYLTANSGLVLTQFQVHPAASDRAAAFLHSQLNVSGGLPSFLNADWLALALFHRVGWRAHADRLTRVLQARINELSAADLAWLIDSLTSVGLTAEDALVDHAAGRLGELQQPDGRWHGDDQTGSLDCTLQAVSGFIRLGWFESHPFFN